MLEYILSFVVLFFFIFLFFLKYIYIHFHHSNIKILCIDFVNNQTKDQGKMKVTAISI